VYPLFYETDDDEEAGVHVQVFALYRMSHNAWDSL
jgi:hypothetical protein